MITLGIETSCDETSVAVVRGTDRILSNVVVSSLGEHRRFGGVVPEIASRAHLEELLPCLDLALKKAKISARQIDLVAVTKGPGLMGSLLVGVSAAKALSLALGKPLVGVDHVLAHLYAVFLGLAKTRFPFVGLVVSGGHTLLIRMDAPDRTRVLGRTVDDAAGEAFDKVAKILGLGYPGGPAVDRLAKGQETDRFFFKRPILSEDSLDFSFSGLKTAVFLKAEELKKRRALNARAKRQICAGFQEAVCDVLVKKSLDACRRESLKRLVVGGGVSANSRLRRKLTAQADGEGIEVLFPESALCQDNAAMIAGLGAALYSAGRSDSLDLAPYSEFMKKPDRRERRLMKRSWKSSPKTTNTR